MDNASNNIDTIKEWLSEEDLSVSGSVSKHTVVKIKDTLDRVKSSGEAIGLSSNAIETAQAVALGTIEGGKALRR